MNAWHLRTLRVCHLQGGHVRAANSQINHHHSKLSLCLYHACIVCTLYILIQRTTSHGFIPFCCQSCHPGTTLRRVINDTFLCIRVHICVSTCSSAFRHEIFNILHPPSIEQKQECMCCFGDAKSFGFFLWWKIAPLGTLKYTCIINMGRRIKKLDFFFRRIVFKLFRKIAIFRQRLTTIDN